MMIVFHNTSHDLFRDGAFSCRNENGWLRSTLPPQRKADCRRYAGKPTPRRRVGRLVCAAKTRARKAERAYPIAVPLGKGGGETSPLPAATRRPAG